MFLQRGDCGGSGGGGSRGRTSLERKFPPKRLKTGNFRQFVAALEVWNFKKPKVTGAYGQIPVFS
jgi:hypothetical protein